MKNQELPKGFLSSYHRNRVRSLLHRWYSLWDAQHPEPTELFSLLADDFELTFAGQSFATLEALRPAYDAIGQQLIARSHHVHGIRVHLHGAGRISAEVELHYQRVPRDTAVCESLFSHIAIELIDIDGQGLRIRRYRTAREARSEPSD